MPVSELLVVGLKLMGMGMGIVFTFLVVLVFTMKGMSRFAAKFNTTELQAANQNTLQTTLPAHAESDKQLIAVISAAISRFRRTDA